MYGYNFVLPQINYFSLIISATDINGEASHCTSQTLSYHHINNSDSICDNMVSKSLIFFNVV